jgi:hypothetical protein
MGHDPIQDIVMHRGAEDSGEIVSVPTVTWIMKAGGARQDGRYEATASWVDKR